MEDKRISRSRKKEPTKVEIVKNQVLMTYGQSIKGIRIRIFPSETECELYTVEDMVK